MDPDCIQHPEVNESCLFDTRDHFDVDSSFLTYPLDEFGTVFGLTYGTRRNRAKLCIVRLGNFCHAGQALYPAINSVIGKLFHIAATVANAHHIFLTRYDFKATRDGLGDYEVEAVGADIQRRHEVAHLFRR